MILGASKRVGFIFGGLVASMSLQIPSSWPTTNMADFHGETTDPDQLGAWWLGFMIHGISMILLALPMACFPKRMLTKPQTPERRRKKSSTHIREAEIKINSIDHNSGLSPRRKISQVYPDRSSQYTESGNTLEDISDNTINTDDKDDGCDGSTSGKVVIHTFVATI